MKSDLLSMLIYQTRDRNIAEEVLQQTFANVLVRQDSYRGGTEDNPEGWIWVIARRALADYFRREGAPMRSMTEEFQHDQRVIETSTPVDVAMHRERNQLIHNAIDQLPSHYAAVIRLSYFEGLSGNEIGEQLGQTRKNVNVWLTRARRALQNSLQVIDNPQSAPPPDDQSHVAQREHPNRAIVSPAPPPSHPGTVSLLPQGAQPSHLDQEDSNNPPPL